MPRGAVVAASVLFSAIGFANPHQTPGQRMGAPQAPDLDAVDPETGEPLVMIGEKLDPELCYGPGIIESMDEVMERERRNPSSTANHKARNGAQGSWAVPGMRTSQHAHSGDHYVFNKWGDTRMGIGFGRRVDLLGAWFAGQGAEPLWADGVRIVGYRDGLEVARTAWLEGLNSRPEWFDANLFDVDRIEIEARPVYRGAGWFSLDDLTLRAHVASGQELPEPVVIDFDDLGHKVQVTGSGYAGLTWEQGTGEFDASLSIVHPPKTPPDLADPASITRTLESWGRGSGTAPTLDDEFAGPRLGDPGAGWLPPDTCGSVGIDHFVAVVNQHLSVYQKSNGNRQVNTSLQNFFNTGGSAGDPRVVFDPDSERFIVIAADFSSRLFLAVSRTSDPTGSWFKTTITLSTGGDAGRWPDYPTLGVDAYGIYSASYMVGGGGMTLWAIDKAPLISASPSLGTVTAFRNLPWEGAIQPCVTYGDPGVGYCISRRNSTSLRLRYVQGPLTSPTLVQAGIVSVPSHSSAPAAPALGSVAPLDTLDTRPMNAVYRNGSVYTAHSINQGGRAACRWYEVDTATASSVQVGTVKDTVMSYFMPGISVNAVDDVILGFSGSSPNQYAAAYLAGRRATDSLNELSDPVLLKQGNAAYNQAGSGGVNRWGDYSLSSIDPVDDLTLWTIQEHTRSTDTWGTWIGKAVYDQTVCDPPYNFCTTTPNTVGPGAIMTYSGSTSIATADLELIATGCPSGQFGIFYYGASQISTPFGEGIRCVGSGGFGTYRFPPFQTDLFGGAFMPVDFSSPPAGSGAGMFFPGEDWNFQFWYRDPSGGPNGFNLSDGMNVTFCL